MVTSSPTSTPHALQHEHNHDHDRSGALFGSKDDVVFYRPLYPIGTFAVAWAVLGGSEAWPWPGIKSPTALLLLCQ